jgi:hypothetical protein
VKLVQAYWKENPARVEVRLKFTNVGKAPLPLFVDQYKFVLLSLYIRGLGDSDSRGPGGWTWLMENPDILSKLSLAPRESFVANGSWRFNDTKQRVEISAQRLLRTITYGASMVSEDGSEVFLPGGGPIRQYKATWEIAGVGLSSLGHEKPAAQLLAGIRTWVEQIRARRQLAARRAVHGRTDHLPLYLSRITLVRDKILGAAAGQIETLTDKADEFDRNTDPEKAESYYREAHDLFVEAYHRCSNLPVGHYDHLVTWKYEYTQHGTRRPTIDEALMEAYISDIYTEYIYCLRSLKRKGGAEAEYAENRIWEVDDLCEKLFRTAATTLRQNIWIEERLENRWDPIRDTEFYQRVVLEDPNFEDADTDKDSDSS